MVEIAEAAHVQKEGPNSRVMSPPHKFICNRQRLGMGIFQVACCCSAIVLQKLETSCQSLKSEWLCDRSNSIRTLNLFCWWYGD